MYGHGPPFPPTDYVASGKSLSTELGGRDRFKYFKRPVVPVMEAGGTAPPGTVLGPTSSRPNVQRSLALRQQMLQTASTPSGTSSRKPPRVLEKITAAKAATMGAAASTSPSIPFNVAVEAEAVKSTKAGARDMSIQTLYRENECQTDPYTPDYFVEEGQQPEVLAIMELRYGEGLPAALAEVEMIDRVQRRKKVEQELPQGSDPVSMQQRLEALETLERTEWEERELHIKGLQDNRLKHMDQALRRREQRREEKSLERIEVVKRQKLEEVEKKLQLLKDQRAAATRKLTSKHSNPCAEKVPRDVIKDHSTYGAKAIAAKDNSLVEKVSTTNYDVRPTLLGFVEGVQELERAKVPKLESVKGKSFVPPEEAAINTLTTNYQKRLAHQVVDHLEHANSVIKKSHETAEKTASIQDLYRATPRLQRPDTPTLVLQGDEDEERDEAMLLLQRLLRGRAVQNDFFEGKERCHGLIEELQAAQNAKENEGWWLPDKERELFREKQEHMAQSVVDGVLGDIVFGTLDYLYKELLRQKEAAKVDVLREHAEATRHEREAAEAKRRQDEEALRRREDYQYSRLMESTDYIAETYLVQLISETVHQAAHTQAIAEQLQRSHSVTKVPTSDLEREEMVCTLLDSFVIPHVCRNLGINPHRQESRAYAEVATNAADILASNVAAAANR